MLIVTENHTVRSRDIEQKSYIYIYIDRKRERERESEFDRYEQTELLR